MRVPVSYGPNKIAAAMDETCRSGAEVAALKGRHDDKYGESVTFQNRTDALLAEQGLPYEEALLIGLPVRHHVIQSGTSGHTSIVWKVFLEGGMVAYFKPQGGNPLAASYGHDPDEVFLMTARRGVSQRRWAARTTGSPCPAWSVTSTVPPGR